MRIALLALSLAACSSGGPFVSAEHTPLPLIAAHQKDVLAQPQIVTITFPGYAYKAQVQAFGDFLGGSQWLKTVGAEYGIGASTQLAKVVWPTAAPDMITDQDLRALIGKGITDGTLPAPATGSSQNVYTVYWPSTSVLDASGQGAGVVCLRGSFHSAGGLFVAGYHDSFLAPNGTRIDYVVVGDCSGGADLVTSTASRELIGAFTNPHEFENSGWLLDVMPTDPWFMDVNSGEVGYMCERELGVSEGGFALHRSWSNAAAMASTQPCVPAPEGPSYYNVSASPSATNTVAAGATVVYTLTGWSSEKVAPWGLVMEKPESSDFSLADLQPAFGTATLGNGQTTTLTIHVPSTATKAQLGGINVMSGPQQHAWPVAFTVE